MTAGQLREWMSYYAMEPWGEERADLRAGIVASTVANVHRGRAHAFRPADFMPRFGEPARRQSPQAMLAVLRAAAEAARAGIEARGRAGRVSGS